MTNPTESNSVEFSEWLARAVEKGVPESVRAFCFNLLELGRDDGGRFSVEVVGANKFSATESDWACEENWEPMDRILNLPASVSGETWESCLSAVQSLIQKTLATDSEVARILKSREGIGVGFVDGDLHIIRP